MYDQLLRAIDLYFDEVKVLRRSVRGVITLLRHRKTGKRYVFRQFTGSADVYRRLLTEKNKARAAVYAIAANLCSAVFGLWLIDPLWHFIVSIS